MGFATSVVWATTSTLPVRTYSSGMLLRLAFAVVTSMQRDIVLMDEWLSVGDAEFKVHAAARLREFVDRTAILILATHSMNRQRKFCNRKIELNHGRIVNDEQIAGSQ